jgi:hypothetical protein
MSKEIKGGQDLVLYSGFVSGKGKALTAPKEDYEAIRQGLLLQSLGETTSAQTKEALAYQEDQENESMVKDLSKFHGRCFAAEWKKINEFLTKFYGTEGAKVQTLCGFSNDDRDYPELIGKTLLKVNFVKSEPTVLAVLDHFGGDNVDGDTLALYSQQVNAIEAPLKKISLTTMSSVFASLAEELIFEEELDLGKLDPIDYFKFELGCLYALDLELDYWKYFLDSRNSISYLMNQSIKNETGSYLDNPAEFFGNQRLMAPNETSNSWLLSHISLEGEMKKEDAKRLLPDGAVEIADDQSVVGALIKNDPRALQSILALIMWQQISSAQNDKRTDLLNLASSYGVTFDKAGNLISFEPNADFISLLDTFHQDAIEKITAYHEAEEDLDEIYEPYRS